MLKAYFAVRPSLCRGFRLHYLRSRDSPPDNALTQYTLLANWPLSIINRARFLSIRSLPVLLSPCDYGRGGQRNGSGFSSLTSRIAGAMSDRSAKIRFVCELEPPLRVGPHDILVR